MLGIFHHSIAHPPQELKSPSDTHSDPSPQNTLHAFLSSHPSSSTLSISFSPTASLTYDPSHPNRVFCGYEDMHCLFIGSLNNLSALNRQYGLHKGANEPMLVIEAYRTLRDRAPYPADQVVKDLDGSFAFLLYDHKAQTVFAALSSDGGVGLQWGIAVDGSLVFSDDPEVMKAGCVNSFAPFPRGGMFHSEAGVMSFEHPMYRMKATTRTNKDGVVCGSNFKVDKFSRVNSMPRVGSETNWDHWISN